MTKPRVAFFDFASCEGCQLQVLSLEDQLLDILGVIDIVTFREAMTEKSDDYDIAFIEGSITTTHDIERIKIIREKAKILIALGQCATTGGVNYLKNFQNLDEVRKYVYGDKAPWFETIKTRPVEAVVKVDYWIYGCPINKDDFLRVVKDILMGKKQQIPAYPVCVECRQKENVCLFEKGQVCMGPVTRGGGCNAWCPTSSHKCYGCRGVVEDPNVNSESALLRKYGYSIDDILNQLRLFDGYREEKT